MPYKEQPAHLVRRCFAAIALLLFVPFVLLLFACGNSVSEPAPQPTPIAPSESAPDPTPVAPSGPAPNPAPVPGSVFRFVAWSDTQGGNTTLAALAAQVLTLDPAFTLHSGDGESQGFTTSGRDLFVAAMDGNSNDRVSGKTFFVRGNHDASDTAGWQMYNEVANVAGSVGATHFSAFTPDLTYSFDFKNSHFVAIDVPGNANVMTSAQIAWLDSDLGAAEGRGLTHAFLFFHGPIFCVESVHCGFREESGSYASQALIEVLNKYSIVSASFHGHEHVLAHTHMDSARLPSLTHDFEQIVAATAGSHLYACDLPGRIDWCEPAIGFATIDVSERAFRVSFYQKGISAPIKTLDFSK